jgi:hypothetical protein
VLVIVQQRHADLLHVPKNSLFFSELQIVLDRQITKNFFEILC